MPKMSKSEKMTHFLQKCKNWKKCVKIFSFATVFRKIEKSGISKIDDLQKLNFSPQNEINSKGQISHFRPKRSILGLKWPFCDSATAEVKAKFDPNFQKVSFGPFWACSNPGQIPSNSENPKNRPFLPKISRISLLQPVCENGPFKKCHFWPKSGDPKIGQFWDGHFLQNCAVKHVFVQNLSKSAQKRDFHIFGKFYRVILSRNPSINLPFKIRVKIGPHFWP